MWRCGCVPGARAGNSLAGPGKWWSSAPMAHCHRTQPPHDPSPPPGTPLDAASVEAVARRVVQLIHDEDHSRGRRLVDAATLAAGLGVERSWVYAHRRELGAIELGTGSKPRLRFDVESARKVLARSASNGSHEPKPPAPMGNPARRRRQQMGSDPGCATHHNVPGRWIAVTASPTASRLSWRL
jgi:hypothetical protein